MPKKTIRPLDAALQSFKKGLPVLVFDAPAREGETDIVLHASFCHPERVRTLRKEAGGMICLVTDADTGRKLGLPFFDQTLADSPNPTLRALMLKKMPYGDSTAFSIYLNSRQTFTGISDDDRSLTIKSFERMLAEGGESEFTARFYSPGHVPLLISRGIERRQGHTEMAAELARRAGLTPAVVICEMLADDGKALSFEGAQAYAKKNGLAFLDGQTLLKGERES